MNIFPPAIAGERGTHRFRLLLTVPVFIILFMASIGRTEDTPPELSALIAEAMESNQELRSIEDKVRAMEEEAPAAGSLQDPMVGIALANVPIDTFDFAQEPMTQKQLFVSQKFPWFGTLPLKEQVATLKALEQERVLEARRLAIARQVAETWYELLFVDRNLEVNARLAAIVTQILKVAETRYSTGVGLQQDILAAQVQLSELIEENVALKSKERFLADRMGSLLNRAEPYRQETVEMAMPESTFDAEVLTAKALRFSPQLAAQRIARERAGLEIELAEKDYMPNIDVRLGYGQREDTPTGADRADFLSVGATFSVPLWQNTKQDNNLAAAKRRLLSAEKGLRGLELALPHKIDGAIAEIESARENRKLFADVLSFQAGQLADSSLAAYSVGKLEFNTMLAARLRLERIELKSERYKFDIYKKLAELKEMVGSPLTY